MGAIAILGVLAIAILLVVKALANPPALRFTDLARRLGGVSRTLAEERPYLRALGWFAAILAPVWLILVVIVAVTIFTLFWRMDAVSAEALRWHTLAIGTMIVALAGLLGTPLALIRVWTSERQTHTIEQGHVTDRLTKAIEQLGAEKTVKRTVDDGQGGTRVDERTEPNIEVRLGAIYALERIAQDSERDHMPVMETLCAYIRENATADEPTEESYQDRPRADVKAVLDVLSRRPASRINMEAAKKFTLDLTFSAFSHRNLTWLKIARVNLSFARLEGANLIAARLVGAKLGSARLEGAKLNWAVLDGADLDGASLENASLRSASLEGAILTWARLEGADLSQAQFNGANLNNANLQFAELSGWSCARCQLRSTNFAGAKNLDPNSIKLAFGIQGIGRSRTVLPEGFHYPKHWHKAEPDAVDSTQSDHVFDAAYRSWLETLPEEQVEEA